MGILGRCTGRQLTDRALHATGALDEASGWYRSPDGAWSYNSATFIFFHAATGGYYTYDATQQSYVSVRCEYGADGQLHVVQQEPAQPVAESAPPEFAVSVEGATMQGRRQKQEDRFTIIADLRSTLSESGCATAPPLPASFCGVYDGHAGHDTSEFVAEQLHKDIATSLAARQTGANDSGNLWSDELIVAAIKDGFAKTDATFLNWARELLQSHAKHSSYVTHLFLRQDRLELCCWIPSTGPRRRKDGSTAVTALVLGQKLYVAWLGDSRALVLNSSHKVTWASEDHKPNRPDEVERVKKAGGAQLPLFRVLSLPDNCRSATSVEFVSTVSDALLSVLAMQALVSICKAAGEFRHLRGWITWNGVQRDELTLESGRRISLLSLVHSVT